MEEDRWSYEGGAEAVLQNKNTYVQLLRRSETRYKRMAKILAVALVLVLAGALPLLLTVLLGRQHVPPDSQPTMPPASLSGIKPETARHENPKIPSAMLTAPTGNNTNGKYLQWAHDIGIAYCHGGFNYSNGDLVVPRNGLYSVFLQITYQMECPGRTIKLMNTVSHVKEEYGKDMNLLSSSHTVSCSTDGWSKSLYTAGLFFLKAKDRLHVTSSYPEYITKREYEVFFGAVFLSH
ncbi:lymphotoxin-alpha-like [Archocentrus centrarchus]|uniref:lymphotoxin-alpha-like n=1 Tax=Archocentrus centrarchus TaxID=63155 RepID=UPI0011E9D077|nr:lymphotoxin-alpha-like [Archocentrus centrarchus]